MSSQYPLGIRIHPPGSGRITNAQLAGQLAAKAPRAFNAAQHVLVATEKYVKKRGFFSSERSRIKKLQASLYALSNALEADGYSTSKGDFEQRGRDVCEFLSEFSDAFPNWQKEYEALNRFVPMCF